MTHTLFHLSRNSFAYIFTFHKSTVNVTGDGDEELRSFRVMSLYSGGTFDKNYNKRYEPIKFSVPASTKKVTDPLVDPLKSFLSVWVSVLSSVLLISGGDVRRHHSPRLRRQPLWRVLRDLPPLPAQRCLQQHTNIRLCRWEISRQSSHQISMLLALHQESLLLLDLGSLKNKPAGWKQMILCVFTCSMFKLILKFNHEMCQLNVFHIMSQLMHMSPVVLKFDCWHQGMWAERRASGERAGSGGCEI